MPFDEGAAEIIATLLNIHRDKKKRSEPFTRADVLRGLRHPDDDEPDDPNDGFFNRMKVLAGNG